MIAVCLGHAVTVPTSYPKRTSTVSVIFPTDVLSLVVLVAAHCWVTVKSEAIRICLPIPTDGLAVQLTRCSSCPSMACRIEVALRRSGVAEPWNIRASRLGLLHIRATHFGKMSICPGTVG